jgi:hypothetical protein
MRSDGLALAGAVRLENQIPNRLLRAGVPIHGAQQRETPTFSVDGVLSGIRCHLATDRPRGCAWIRAERGA